jgi:GntR family transcriptional regulator/MocR family aminotransferase
VPESQTNLAWDTLIDLTGAGPLHERLTRSLRSAIRAGRVGPGSALPPSRKLATDLGCSRWVVTEAYAQLVAEGYLHARTGSATRVRWSEEPPADRRTASPPATAAPRFDLVTGLPDLRAFPRRRWADASRAEIASAPFTDLAYPSRAGHARLRQVLAEYLTRCRGALAGPEEVTVSRGVTDGVGQSCRALAAAGVEAVAVEDPGWPRLATAARQAGLGTVPVRVDAEGLRVDDLAAHDRVRAVIVAPAHQFPTGAVLSPRRRAALIEWARRVGGVVLEDDYDAEFRYDRRPVGTVQGMDPARVFLFGSVSKTLAPALGIGWIVAPSSWTEALRAEGPATPGPPVLDQLALARFISSGAHDRHLRACRQRYRARRDALLGALAAALPGCRVSGAAAGLHMVLHLGANVDAAAVVEASTARGVRVAELAAFGLGDGGASDCLVVGYGNLPDPAVVEAVSELAAAVRDAAAAVRTTSGTGLASAGPARVQEPD